MRLLTERPEPKGALVATGAASPDGTGATETLEREGVDVVSTSELPKKVDHDPENLTVRVSSGVRASRLTDELGQGGQWLPVSRRGDHQSVGGLVAAARPGRWDEAYGPVRRQLLAVELVDHAGTVRRWGRRVVKNVAGYDMPRLVCGSRGRLGVILSATFRVWPDAESRRTVGLGPGGDALEAYVALGPEEEFRPDAAVWRWARGRGGFLELELRGPPASVEERFDRARRWADAAGLTRLESEASVSRGGPESETREGRRFLDGALVRLQAGSSRLAEIARRLGEAGAGEAGDGPVSSMEAFPRAGVLRVRLRSAGDDVEHLGRLLAAAPEATFAVERGRPDVHEALEDRRSEGVRELEARIVGALGGGPRHWIADYV